MDIANLAESLFLMVWGATLMVAVGWVFIGRPGRGFLRAGLSWQATVIVAVGSSCLVLGTVGLWQEQVEASREIAGRAVADQKQTALEKVGEFGAAIADSFFGAVQHLIIQRDAAEDEHMLTRASRWAGLATFVLVAHSALQLLLADSISRWLHRRNKNHFVICGLGRIGSQLVQDLLDQKRWSERGWNRPPKVIVVESRPDNIHISTARELGAIIVPGSAVDERLLRNIRAELAQHVFFLTGADEVNLEGAADLLKLIRGDIPNKHVIPQTAGVRRDCGAVSTPRISVHLNNQELDAVLQLAVEQHVSDCQGNIRHENVVARSFNLVDQSIRKMIEEHLIPLRPTINPAHEDAQLLDEWRAKDNDQTSQADAVANPRMAPYEVAHFVIVGMGQAGQHLAVTLAHLAHFENLVRPRMTIVYAPHEAEEVAAFQKSYPRLLSQTVMHCEDLRPRCEPDGHMNIDPWMPPPEMDDWGWGVHVADVAIPHESDCGVAFVANGGFVELPGSLTSDEFIQPLIHLSLSPGVRTFVFVCRSTDDINCSEAIELRDEIDDRIKSRTSQGGLAYSHRDHTITVFGYVPERRMLTRLVSRSRLNADLVLFGDCYESCRLEDLTNDIAYPLAEEIAHSYAVKAWRRKIESQQTQGSQSGAGVTASELEIPRTRLQSLRPWERQSNLWAAAHLNVKLAAIGKRLVPRINRARPTGAPVTLDEPSRLLLAKMEHNRYLAERLMAGWAFGKRAIPENKRRFAFVDWDHLGNHEWVKDLDQIEIILAFLRNHPDIVIEDLPRSAPAPAATGQLGQQRT